MSGVSNVDNSQSVPSMPALLTLRLVRDEHKQSDKYAVVTRPETYDDAVKLAIKLLGHHMSRPHPDSVFLCCSTKNRDGNWIWARMIPEHWQTVINNSRGEIGIFESTISTPHLGQFVQGLIGVSYGSTNGYRMTWTLPFINEHNRALVTSMDRPRTFQDAVNRVKLMINQKRFWQCPDPDNKRFTFYKFTSTRGGFPSTDSWVKMPPKVVTDDDAWRLCKRASSWASPLNRRCLPRHIFTIHKC